MSEVTESPRTQDPARHDEQTAQRPEQSALRPLVDIFERADGVTLRLDMPGVSRERLTIHSDRDSLVVEGEAEIDLPEGMESLYADVRSTHYRRSFSLAGEQLDTDAIDAALKNGVLTIRIPKRSELKPRRIEVQAG